jgi:hypothetical protein
MVTAVLHRRSVDQPYSLLVRMSKLVRRQWFPACLLLFMAFLPLWHMPDSSWSKLFRAAFASTVLANFAMIGCALWLMSTGLREDRVRPFAAGVLYFLLWAILRYVDLFGDFGGMLGAAFMFFLCGATLFSVALYWRRRKEIRHA